MVGTIIGWALALIAGGVAVWSLRRDLARLWDLTQ